jgi:hypothetical protein
MSIEISVSKCKDLLTIMKNYGQDCRVTKTRSVVKNQFEKQWITFGESLESYKKIWQL